jgi:hypothetical protein
MLFLFSFSPYEDAGECVEESYQDSTSIPLG